MSVLKGEGNVPILFGMKSVSAGAITHGTYLARPDLTGEWPTLVIVPPAWGVTSAVADLARRMARRGIAAIVVDLYRGNHPARTVTVDEAEAAFAEIPVSRARRDLSDIADFIANRAGFWSNAEQGFGILGLGSGGVAAAEAALDSGAALVLVASSLPTETLAQISTPILGIFGKDDEVSSIDAVMEARSAAPHAEWVLYEGVGHDFLDDYLDGFDAEAHQNAVERIAAFCEKHLPRPA